MSVEFQFSDAGRDRLLWLLDTPNTARWHVHRLLLSRKFLASRFLFKPQSGSMEMLWANSCPAEI